MNKTYEYLLEMDSDEYGPDAVHYISDKPVKVGDVITASSVDLSGTPISLTGPVLSIGMLQITKTV